MLRFCRVLTLVATGVPLALGAVPGRAQAPPPAAPPGGFSLEVRTAPAAEVVQRLGEALRAPLQADEEYWDRPVTLLARGTTLEGFQRAMAAFYRTSWRAGEGGSRLLAARELLAEGERVQAQRDSALVAQLLRIAGAARTGDAGAIAAQIRQDVARRMPQLPERSLDDIDADLVRRTVLLLPLKEDLTAPLLRDGVAWLPFTRLTAGEQRLMAGYVVARSRVQASPGRGAPRAAPIDPLVLNQPLARVEYRILYGDRWTGTVLLVRVGASDNWATALFPSTLVPLPDFGSVFPPRKGPVEDPRLGRKTELRIDTDSQSWDQALAAIAAAAGLSVLSDSYPRPSVFRPPVRGPVLTAPTIGELLERAADYYGYVWWREGDWLLFRNRMWFEEERVAVPEDLKRSLGEEVGATGHLSPAGVASLADLSEEQLLTMHLFGRAGAGAADAAEFDFGEMQLVRAGVSLFAGLAPEQQRAAIRSSVPAAEMQREPFFIFSSAARDRGLPLAGAAGSFSISDRFRRERLAAGWAEVGTLQMWLDFGAAGSRSAELALRLPAAARAPAERKTP